MYSSETGWSSLTDPTRVVFALLHIAENSPRLSFRSASFIPVLNSTEEQHSSFSASSHKEKRRLLCCMNADGNRKGKQHLSSSKFNTASGSSRFLRTSQSVLYSKL